MFTDAALTAAVALMVPLMVVVTWYDLRYLRIPNWSVLAIFVVFVGVGIWGLPLDVFLWRIGYAVLALGAGFALYTVVGGRIGAGDLKLLAALAPFLSGANLVSFILIYIAMSLAGLFAFYALRWRFGGTPTGWMALDQGAYFPAGVLLGVSMAVQLCLDAQARFG